MEKSCDTCRFHNADYNEEPCESWIKAKGRTYWTPNNDTDKDPKARYYDAGNIETLDIIKAKLTPEQYEGFLLGNMIKYSCRANFKDQKTRDIEKISFYSDKLVGVTKWHRCKGQSKNSRPMVSAARL